MRNKELLSRVITFLTREELDYIDKLSKDSLFSTGTKLPRAKVIEGMVEACMKSGITGENIHSKEELMKKIFEAIRARDDFQNGKRRENRHETHIP